MVRPVDNSKKISELVGTTTLPDSALITVVINGQNFKMTKADFLNVLGVTGSIEQDGAATGTPILDIDGTVNKIRNLESGPGVIASVSPENGATIEHNFDFSQVGVPISSNPTDAQPDIVSFTNGTGIQLTSNNNVVTITATGVTAATNTIIINQESDFAIQDATTITLENCKNYILGDDITTAKRFILGAGDGVTFTANNPYCPVLTYTGTGDMFTITDANFEMRLMRPSAPSANQVFNVTDTAGGTLLFRANGIRIADCPKIGTFNDLLTFNIENSSAFADDGFTFTGTSWLIIAARETAIIGLTAGNKGFDLGSAISPTIEIQNSIVTGDAAAFGVSGLANSGNIPTGQLGMVTDGTFTTVTPFENILSSDIRWRLRSNSGASDTIEDALLSISGNATETVISTINTPVKMAGTWTVERESLFTGDTTGRATFDSEIGVVLPIDISVSVLMASGGAKNVTAYVAINGSIISSSGRQVSVSSSQAENISLIWQYDFQENDYVELFLENNSGTTNIIGQSAVLRVR